jgi:hypothetical protein
MRREISITNWKHERCQKEKSGTNKCEWSKLFYKDKILRWGGYSLNYNNV